MVANLRKLRWILPTLLALSYVPQIPGCVLAHVSKDGRVIDALTGAGLPDAFVIATAYVTTSGGLVESRTTTNLEYLFVARTDAAGNYSIPSTFSHLNLYHFIPGFGSLKETWKVVAFKPSYVYAEDLKWILDSGYLAGYKAEPEVAWFWHGFHIEAEPLRLQEYILPLNQAVMYYKGYQIGSAPEFGPETRALVISDEAKNVDILLHQLLKSRICSLDKDSKLDNKTTKEAAALAVHPSKAKKTLENLEPNGFELKEPHQFKDEKDYPDFSAKNVCLAMQQEVSL
jgi:hypothetical protein